MYETLKHVANQNWCSYIYITKLNNLSCVHEHPYVWFIFYSFSVSETAWRGISAYISLTGLLSTFSQWSNFEFLMSLSSIVLGNTMFLCTDIKNLNYKLYINKEKHDTHRQLPHFYISHFWSQFPLH